jgi:5'-3' exonuclease
MINICIDGNYIFHKTFGIFAGYGDVDPGKILRNKKDQSAFIRKISTDLCSSLKMLPSGGRLIFTSDSSSWRRGIEIEDGGYKSGRVKDENVDWSTFFELLQSFGKHLEKMGFIFSKVQGAEGDDLLMFWSDYFVNLGENCLIITGDKDLHQLVKDQRGSWTAVWNNNSKKNTLSVPVGWKDDWLEKEDAVNIFNMASSLSPEKQKLKEFLKKVNVEEIESNFFILNKILIGDKGDSIPSVWEFQSEGKIKKFTPKKSESFIDFLKSTEWNNLGFLELIKNDSFMDWASGYILRLSKYIDNSENREKVKKNILRNFTLMWLNSEMIPEEIRSSCISEIERGIEKPKKNITLDRIKILEGTDWVSSDFVPRGLDPFENLIK